MKITHDGTDYYLEFRHEFDPEWEERSASMNGVELVKHKRLSSSGEPRRRPHNKTTCTVLRCKQGGNPKEAKVFCAGTAFCSILDLFCKEYGRKGALKSALKQSKHAIVNSGFCKYGTDGKTEGKLVAAKGLRTAIWKAYLGRK